MKGESLLVLVTLLSLVDVAFASKNRMTNARWSSNGTTILGENHPTQLKYPRGLAVRSDGTIYVADFSNNRIVEQNANRTTVRTFGLGELNQPTDVLLEKDETSLIICDYGNRRLVRWSLLTNRSEEMFIADDDCRGLAMDNRGYLYVSDGMRNEIRRYRIGERMGIVVAGRSGQGNALDEFNKPLFIAVDEEYSIYVADKDNSRVMKWKENAREGLVVAGGKGMGTALNQLHHPLGIAVDPWKNIYIADSGNGRVMRWREGQREGEIIVGNIGVDYPVGLGFDAEWNLYLVDGQHFRVLKFDLLS